MMNDTPAVSIYVPLKWSDYGPGKIYSALVKSVDRLLLKDGHSKLNLKTPDWDLWIKQGTTTLAIFYHAGMTNLIPIPTRMQPRVVVANSFHLKPIIAAANEYIDGLLLHFNESGASLYRISPAGEAQIDTYLPTKFGYKSDWPYRIKRHELREFLEFVNQEVKGSIQTTTKILGITGAAYSELRSESFWKKTNLPVFLMDESFEAPVPHNSFSIMRLRLSQLVNEKHSIDVLEAQRGSITSNEPPCIKILGEKILNKKIAHLCVSLDDMQFGELDSDTGKLSINKNQSNSKDDDLLDDLVELALARGIKVSVVPKKFLPQGRIFVAS